MGLSTHTPVASGPILPEPVWWMQRDLTRKYHAEIFQRELAFRGRLSHELLQREFSKSPNQIFWQEYSKNLHQNGLKPPDAVLPRQPGWSSLCDVDSKTEVLEKHNIIDKQVLMSKELKDGSDNGREEHSEQQKTQSEQQQQERDINDDLEKQEKSMKNDSIPFNECKRSLNSNQLTTKECVVCNKVFNFQNDFESHLAGRKHAKKLQRMACLKGISEVKDDSKKCENANEKKLVSIESGLLAKDNVEKILEKEFVQKVKDNGDLVAKEDKVGMKENAELNEQQQIMVGGMPSKLWKRSSNLSELSIKNCKISYVKGDEQKSAENKPVQKVKDDKDLGAKINEVDMKKNEELIDQHQMKEGNSKQQKAQIEQQMTEGNSKQQKPQMEQRMMEGGIPSKEYEGSLNSNPLKIKDCVICNIALKHQVDFEAHVSGRKHAKQLKKMETKLVQKVADDSDFDTKSNKVGMKETDECELEQMNASGVSSKMCKMLSNARQLSIEECKISKEKDDVNKSDTDKLFWKVKDDTNLDAKRNRVDMKENAELNEQCLMKEGNSEQQNFQSEQKMEEGKSKQLKLQMEQQMKEENSKSQKLLMKQQIMETSLPNKQHEGLTSEQLKVTGYRICNTALNSMGDSEKELARMNHNKQLKIMETKLVQKVADDSDFDTKSNKVGMKETDECEQEQMNASGVSSKICKMLSNARQLSIEECKISKEKDDVNKSDTDKLVWKVKDDRNLDGKRNRVDMKENAELNEQFVMKEGNSEQQNFQSEQKMEEGKSKQLKLQMEQQMKEENSKSQKLLMKQQIMETSLPNKQHKGLTSEQLKVNGYRICNTALNFMGDSEKELARMNHNKQLKKMETKLVQKVADDSDFDTKSNKVGMKETDECEQEQMNASGVSSKMCKMLSNARQLSIEECKISKEKDDVNKSDTDKLVWKVKDDRNLDGKRNRVDMKENAELNEQCVMKEGNSEQQNFQSEQKMEDRKSKQLKLQMKQQMKEENSKSQKLLMKQQIMEIGLPNKQHEGLTSEQFKVNGYMICNTALNFMGDSEKELARMNHDKQLKKMETKLVQKVADGGDFDTKINKVGMKESDKCELEQMNARGVSSKMGKMLSNARQLSIEECKISEEKDDVNKSDTDKLVWKVKDDRNLDAKRNRVDMKENAELNEQCLMKEGNSEQQNFQSEQKMEDDKSKQLKLQMEQQMKEENSKSWKLLMKQQIMEIGLPNKQHERLTSEQFKVDGYMIYNTALNFMGDSEEELARMKHDKQLKKVETKLVQKVADGGDFDTKINKVGMKESDECELEQMNARGVSSKMGKMLSNARQLSIEECKISEEKDDVNKSNTNKLVWKVEDDRNLDGKRNRVNMKENAELNEQCPIKEGNSEQQNFQPEQKMEIEKSKQLKLQMEQQMKEEISKSQKLLMKQQKTEFGLPNKQQEGLTSEQLKVNGYMICNTALNIMGDSEELARMKHNKQLKKVETKLVQKVADGSLFDTKSNKVGMKEIDECELEQMNTRGVSSKMCKMLSNARQLSIEECKISKKKDDVNKSDTNKLVWKVKDDTNLDAKRNRVDMKENAELNEQCLMKEGNSEQQNFHSEQKMDDEKSKQLKLQMEQQMKEENSKSQKLLTKQQIMEIGLPNKQHEGLTSKQFEVNGYMICNTALNFLGDSEELARMKHDKQLEKMENKSVWKVTDKRDLCSKSNKVGMNETAELSEKQHMKEKAELSEKQHMKGMKETAQPSEKQHMKGMKETAQPSEKQHMKGGCMSSKICKNSSSATQLSVNEFKIPITKDNVDKDAINQPVWKVNKQRWMKKTNTKQQKLQTEQQLQEKHN